jgi:hypothetical protein
MNFPFSTRNGIFRSRSRNSLKAGTPMVFDTASSAGPGPILPSVMKA